MENLLNTLLLTALYLVAFWAHVGWVRHKAPFRFSGLALPLGLALFWVANLVVFPLGLWVHPILGALLLWPLKHIRYTFKPYGWLIGASFLLLLWLLVIPVAEADSIGYVIPQADNAIRFGTLGVWETDNIRSLARFWGLPALVGNNLLITGGHTEGLEVTSILSLCALLGSLHAALRVWGFRKHRQAIGFVFLSSPILFSSLTAIKDDVAFAAATLLLLVLAYRRVLGRVWLLPVHVLLITSKLFFPLAYLVYLPFWHRQRARIVSLVLPLCAYVLVLAYNAPRVAAGVRQLRQPITSAWAAPFTGAAVAEVDQRYVPKELTPAKTSLKSEANWPIPVDIAIRSFSPLKQLSWGDGAFYYGTSHFGPILVGFYVLGFGYLISRYRKKTHLVLGVSLPVIGFLFTGLSNGNNYRYILGFLTLSLGLGLSLSFQLRALRRGVVVAGALFVAAYVLHPIARQAYHYLYLLRQPAVAANVRGFNSTLLQKPVVLRNYSFLHSKHVLAASIYPGFSAQHLFTDSGRSHLTELPLSALRQLPNRPDYIILGGMWNILGTGYPSWLVSALEAQGYAPYQEMFDYSLVIFAPIPASAAHTATAPDGDGYER